MDSSISKLPPTFQPDGRPSAALAEEVMILHPPSGFDRPFVDREGAALQIHRLLAQVARCRGALDVALGDRLAALAEGDRLLRLGFVSLGDYARERLQLPPRRAQALARLSRELGSRPRLDRAVRQGALSARRAEVVLPVAQGDDEARWVELALDKRVTVRALDELVRAERAASRAKAEGEGEVAANAKQEPEPEPEPFRTLKVELTAEQRELLELSMEIAGQLLGPGAAKWKRLEAICDEYLSDSPIELSEPIEMGEPGAEGAEGAGPEDERASARERSDRVEEILEQSNHFWELLDEYAPAEPVQARERVAATDPFELDRGLCELGRARLGWDELVGRLGLLMRSLGLWRVLGFASLGHYCREQLGMSSRTLQQRAWLEVRLYGLPELRQALRQGEVGYECARLIARVARGFDIDRWLEWAGGRPVLDVRQAVERYEREPSHLRHQAAPWEGACRCEPEPPGRLVELLHPNKPRRRGQPTVAQQPACSANPGEVQMCAPSGEASRAWRASVPLRAESRAESRADSSAESKAELPADERCSPRWGPPRCFEPGPDRPPGGQQTRFAVPESVLELVWTTISVVRERTGQWLRVGECLEVLAAHFATVWLPHLDAKRRRSVSQRIVTRDSGRCTVPGCSRQAEHAHHIRYRSQGGGDEHENLTSECAGHHLAAEHQGFIQVSGRAPDRLTWKLGLRSDEPPLLEYCAGRRLEG